MKTIGAFEAKIHFSQLLAQIAKGETIIVTKHGVPIAKISPIPVNEQMNPAIEAANAIRLLRKGVTLGKKITLKKLIKEGRKR